MTAAGRVQEAQLQLRHARVGRDRDPHLVGVAEAEQGLVEVDGAVELRRGQHDMACAEIARDETRDALRGDERVVGAETAPVKFEGVAVRILAGDELADAALPRLGVAALAQRDARLAQRRHARGIDSLGRHLPSGGDEAVLGTLLDGETERSVVGAQPEATFRSRTCHHADGVDAETAPVFEAAGRYPDVSQREDSHPYTPGSSAINRVRNALFCDIIASKGLFVVIIVDFRTFFYAPSRARQERRHAP